MARNSLVDLDLNLITETKEAILVSDGKREAWLPKSQIEYEPDGKGSVMVTLPEWMAVQKELV